MTTVDQIRALNEQFLALRTAGVVQHPHMPGDSTAIALGDDHRDGHTVTRQHYIASSARPLLPAVQAAREAARRSSCSNNLMQIGLAFHNYELAHEHLPPGVVNPNGPIQNIGQGQHISWTVPILPFIEERAAFQKLDQTAGAYDPKNAAVAGYKVPSYVCPSSADRSEGVIAQTSYAGCYHDDETPIDDDNNGLLLLNSNVRYSDIFDGSSKTILVADKLAIEGSLGWLSGTRATLRNTGSMAGGTYHEPYALANPNDVGGFGSFHSGGVVNCLFADGSVRSLNMRIEPKTFKLYGNRADGELIMEN